jgi:hypothetical protein
MKLVAAVLGFLGCMLLWAIAEAISELLGDGVSAAVAPTWRRVWRVFIRARWHWPALMLVALGVVALVAGYRLHDRYRPDWRGDAGLLLYFAGGIVAAAAAFLWLDGRRAKAREAAQASPKLPSRPAA